MQNEATLLGFASKRDFQRTAERSFEPVDLPIIEYDAPLVQHHLFMANVALTWLGKTKRELSIDLERLLADLGSDGTKQLAEAMADAQHWFKGIAEVMEVAVARSVVVASANLDSR